MKSLIVIALVLSSVAFAGDKASKAAMKEAKAACKAEGKKGKELKACVKEKAMAPAAEAAATPATTAPATK